MLKTKYYYNPAACSYEPVETSISSFIVRSFVYIFFAVVLAILMVKYYQGRFVSPKEIELLQANEKLKAYYHMVQKKIESSTALLNILQERDDTIRVLLNTTPLSASERNAGIGGVNTYAHLGKDTLIAQTLSKVDQLTSQLTIQKKSYDQILNLAKKTASKLQSMPSLIPVDKDNLKRISAQFGKRIHPIYKIFRMHEGIDFAARTGTHVYSAANGHVKWVKNDKKGYGNHLLIEHGNGFQTHYAHMHAINVKEGQVVTRGQKIGTVGNSGDSTAPHLHYEVYYHGKCVNPAKYFVSELTPIEYEAIHKQAVHQTQALCSNF
ncbi:MAG: M23 family metallopeptidase [Candidatus Cardinium sp.]|uniref:M23 family metallopeptidase n=1 Tax=Cardinium endosymbiont of Dermatophagoides farinae TaxID=2597823 RepID=UPI001183A744|nr:M23 family metallopeptidase [Cardinium endosymbiont of Dermatophagoides farinae]TSJ81179.1 M23 family metallopeptidase [Cardinium endosymbiont of Dermatophagoides farinae]UWW97227.1 MAG: M23 family metallopeptidase [Candidatus Cardinium sp.]